ncbi:helix-turn-helix domain-containing protein [Halococcus salifodinae]|uniref:Bacterio-opsin activator HTH domain-containing protein n=1 Tax=Halococcus salifodinae DSM 8989 TaxID=1227456 RepID=M0N231_9EURY|nr:helix-turn-helix domain-containing protein [Halococcus salifodinae]EMA50770.1 Bacterio-opsin activator HTH domain-containing protein [Halococcus salifodinae DSM 8989]
MSAILTIEFETEPTGTLAKLAPAIGTDGSIELDNAFYVEDGTWLESLTLAATSTIDLDAEIDAVPGVSLFHSESMPTGPTGIDHRRAIVFANEPYPFLLELVLRHRAIPNRVVLQNSTATVIATVGEWDDFRAIADDVEAKLGRFDVIRVNETDRPGEPLDSGRLSDVLLSKLTDDQLNVLETAYSMGYFAVPRDASAQAVADELGIQQSTFSERIRTAERAFLELVFSPR